MLDPATGYFEIVRIPNKDSETVANKLEQTWFNRYPWPTEVVMDRGTEFMGEVARMLRVDYGIFRKPITTRNPQANAMVERAHQTVGNYVRTVDVLKEDNDNLHPDDVLDGMLSAIGFAMRSTVHTTTKATPAQLVFGRDQILNTKFIADWQFIKDRKQRLIDQNNRRENAKRIPHTYNVGDTVKVKNASHTKFGSDAFIGPFTVTAVYDNGTLRLQRDTASGGVVTQTWNIRNVVPIEAWSPSIQHLDVPCT